jgi:hypothetical protein
MISYIDRNMAIEAIKQMKSFHVDLRNVMHKHGFDLVSNLGRRNILLSQAQEKFFADQMSRTMDVATSGRTGPSMMCGCGVNSACSRGIAASLTLHVWIILWNSLVNVAGLHRWRTPGVVASATSA